MKSLRRVSKSKKALFFALVRALWALPLIKMEAQIYGYRGCFKIPGQRYMLISGTQKTQEWNPTWRSVSPLFLSSLRICFIPRLIISPVCAQARKQKLPLRYVYLLFQKAIHTDRGNSQPYCHICHMSLPEWDQVQSPPAGGHSTDMLCL